MIATPGIGGVSSSDSSDDNDTIPGNGVVVPAIREMFSIMVVQGIDVIAPAIPAMLMKAIPGDDDHSPAIPAMIDNDNSRR